MTLSFLIMSNRDFKFNRSLLNASILLVFLINQFVAQDIVFPEQTQAGDKGTTRVEVVTTTIPQQKCEQANMVSAVVNGTDEVFCECIQGYLYYAKTDTCYKPYTTGPCEDGKHLILPMKKNETKCVNNPCESDKVPYKGSCYSLLEPGGPCKANETLIISDEFYEPACIKTETSSYNFIDFPMKPCSPGSRRLKNDPRCRVVY